MATTCCPPTSLGSICSRLHCRSLTIKLKPLCDWTNKANRYLAQVLSLAARVHWGERTRHAWLAHMCKLKEIVDNYRPFVTEGCMCLILDQGVNQTRNQSHIKYDPAKDERPRGGHKFQQAPWFPRSDRFIDFVSCDQLQISEQSNLQFITKKLNKKKL